MSRMIVISLKELSEQQIVNLIFNSLKKKSILCRVDLVKHFSSPIFKCIVCGGFVVFEAVPKATSVCLNAGLAEALSFLRAHPERN